MKIIQIFYKLLVLVTIVLIPLQIIAQGANEIAATVNKIATYSEGNAGEKLKVTSLAQFQRSTGNNWFDIKENDQLYYNDILKLNEEIWLRLNVKNRRQNGSICMFPNNLSEPGRYQLMECPEGSMNAALTIESGSAILEVGKNLICTNAGGIKSEVKSGSISRAYFNVRADNSGEIFLQQGHLTFPENSEVTGLKVGQVAQFKDGKITNIFFPDAVALSQYNDLIKFNNKTVWKKPFLKQPVTWIAAAVVAAGTTLIITKPWDKQVSGTVRINWGN